MPSLKPFGASLSLVLGLVLAAQPIVCQTKPLQGGLVVVPSKKLPQQAHEKGESMDLVLVNPDTLYLYVEHENGRKIAIFDVSDPHKMKFKKVIELNAPAAFDFVQPAGESLEMIRYRDRRGIAILDLSKPKNPVIKEVGAAADEYYIVPTGNVGGRAQVDLPQDYQIIQPSTSNAFGLPDVLYQ